MTEREALAGIAAVAREHLAYAGELEPSARLVEDLGLDSLQSLEMLSTLSEELRVDLPMEEAMELRTVADACDFVERAVTSTRAPVAPHA